MFSESAKFQWTFDDRRRAHGGDLDLGKVDLQEERPARAGRGGLDVPEYLTLINSFLGKTNYTHEI